MKGTQQEVLYTEFHSGILQPHSSSVWTCTGRAQYLEHSRYSFNTYLFVEWTNDSKVLIPKSQFPKRKKGRSATSYLMYKDVFNITRLKSSKNCCNTFFLYIIIQINILTAMSLVCVPFWQGEKSVVLARGKVLAVLERLLEDQHLWEFQPVSSLLLLQLANQLVYPAVYF